MSLAAVGSGQHFNKAGGPPPPPSGASLYFRYVIHSILLLILGSLT